MFDQTAFRAAVSEASRLFDAGELTSDLFDPLFDAAMAALGDDPRGGERMESILLFAPNEWLEANTEKTEA